VKQIGVTILKPSVHQLH